MESLLRALLVAAHLAAIALACPASGTNQLHADSARPDASPELRAPCPCGCDDASSAVHLSGPLAAALLPMADAVELPRAAHTGVRTACARLPAIQLPDPVPRLA